VSHQGVQKLIGVIYDFLKKGSISAILFPPRVKKDLRALGQNERQYYTQKLTYFMYIFIVAICLLVVIFFKIYTSEKFEVTTIERPMAHEDAKEVLLEVDGKDVYNVTVQPRILTKEEAEESFHLLVTELERYILGNNASSGEITENVRLPAKMEGYPFSIYWESDKEQVVDYTGNVFRNNLNADEIVMLTAICTYMDYQWEWACCINVLKEELPVEEVQKRKLEALLIEGEEKSRSKEVWNLPEAFDKESLRYKISPPTDKIWLLLALLIITSIALWVGADKDLRSKRKKKQEKFEEEYLNFVSSLSMYISAGLNLQMAMDRCVKDYARRMPDGDVLKSALLRFEKDVLNGHSFQGALDRFAEATDHTYYRRLAGLLHQGLVNGTSNLASVLQQEVEKIREDKKRQCRVHGEKISTALIAPMMLELGVVIALILMPAFSNMQF